MSKPTSRFKLAVREVQMVLSVGAATLIVYALVTSTLAMHLSLHAFRSDASRALLAALLSLGPLLVLAPVICFLVRLVVELHPWRLGVGTVIFVEAALLLLRWDTGALEATRFDVESAAQLVLVALAAVLAGLAARNAAARMAAREAVPAPASAPAQPDLAEQMRQIQASAPPHDDASR